MRDIDGNLYHTVTIGTQIRMTENLKVTKFNDGTPIDIAKDLKSSKSWPYPLYCWYNNDPSDPNHYGILYNYMTVHQTYLVPLYIAPEGWHVPSDEEWNNLIYEKIIKMKEKEMNQAVKNLDFETAAILRDEIMKHFIYWHTHKEGDKDRPRIKKIILDKQFFPSQRVSLRQERMPRSID